MFIINLFIKQEKKMTPIPRFIPSSNADLCFHSLLPTNSTTITTSCSPCELGWNVDNSLWHSVSCTLPDNIYLIILGCASPVALINLSLLLFVGYKKQSTARAIAWWSAAINFTLISIGIALYVQDGWYEGCSILLLFLSTFTACSIAEIWWSFLSPVYVVEGRDITMARKSLLRYVAINLIIPNSLSIALAVVCRNPTQEFNILMSVFFLYALLLQHMFSTVQIVSQRKLEKMLAQVLENTLANQNSSTNQNKIVGLLNRVRKLKQHLYTSYLSNSIALLPTPTVYFMFKVVPYQWIALLIVTVVYQAISVGLLRYLVTTKKPTGTSTSNSIESRKVDGGGKVGVLSTSVGSNHQNQNNNNNNNKVEAD
jgi:hypothetical protein